MNVIKSSRAISCVCTELKTNVSDTICLRDDGNRATLRNVSLFIYFSTYITHRPRGRFNLLEINLVPIGHDAGWAPEPIWMLCRRLKTCLELKLHKMR